MQEILSVITKNESVRSEIQGWTHEDPSMYRRGKDIGYTPGPVHTYTPKTILQALAEGWKLLGPPQPHVQEMWDEQFDVLFEQTHYSWWLVKEKV